MGLKNIISNINNFVNKDSGLKDCVSITIEKGIDHDEKSKLWLYYPEALNWDSLADKLNIEFSDVVNYFDLNFGWYLSSKIHRYTKRGAMIELNNGSEKVDVTSTSIPDLMNFRRQNVKRKNYRTLVYPIDQKIELFKKEKIKPIEKVYIPTLDQNFWIITGSEENLRIGLKHGLWGVKKALDTLWSILKKDDLIFFYCIRPVSGIVGYGKVIDTHIDKKPFWPNEISGKESKYPLRIKFKKIHVVQDWYKDKKSLYGTRINYYHGLNYIEPEKKQIIFKKLKLKI